MSRIKIDGFRTLFLLLYSDHAEARRTRSTPGPQPKGENHLTRRRGERGESNSLASYACQNFKKLHVSSIESIASPVTFRDYRLVIHGGRSRLAFSINSEDTQWPDLCP